MYLIFDSVNNFDGLKLKFGTVHGYRHMAELLVKIAYVVF